MLKENQAPADTDVVITRIFNAPRELVFAAWSDPEQLANWHAPQGCSIEFEKLDFRTGGDFVSVLTTPQGVGCHCKGTYLEIVEPERIVYSLGFLYGPPAGMDPDWPAETVVTVTFENEGSGTKLTLHQTVSEALAKRTGAYPSWLQMLDRLEEVVA